MPITFGELLSKLRDQIPAIENLGELHALLGVNDHDSSDAQAMVPLDVLLRTPVILRELTLAATLEGYSGQTLNDIEGEIIDDCFDGIVDAKMLATINRAAARLGATRK